jgi:hypothetical protein
LVLTIPAGSAGLVSLVIRGSDSILTFTDAFAYVDFAKIKTVDHGQITSSLVSGFAPGSSVLSKTMKSRIKTLVAAHPNETNWGCSGFSQGPTVLKSDAILALNRAKAACAYLKSLLPSAAVSTTIGDNFTELGELYRRVEISWG